MKRLGFVGLGRHPSLTRRKPLWSLDPRSEERALRCLTLARSRPTLPEPKARLAALPRDAARHPRGDDPVGANALAAEAAWLTMPASLHPGSGALCAPRAASTDRGRLTPKAPGRAPRSCCSRRSEVSPTSARAALAGGTEANLDAARAGPDAPSAVAGSCSTPCVAVEALVSPRTWRPARVSQALTSRLSPAGATRRLPARIAQGDDPCVARAPKEPGARPHPKVRSPARSAAVRGVEVLSLTREVSVAPSRHEPVDNLWVKCSQLHT